MKSYHILRIGLGITFVWIGVWIVQDPTGWSGFAPQWIEGILPISLTSFTTMVGVLDAILGLLFLINRLVKPAGYIAAIHLAGILIMGVNTITVRDIGLLGASLALAVHRNIIPSCDRFFAPVYDLMWQHRRERAAIRYPVDD